MNEDIIKNKAYIESKRNKGNSVEIFEGGIGARNINKNNIEIVLDEKKLTNKPNNNVDGEYDMNLDINIKHSSPKK